MIASKRIPADGRYYDRQPLWQEQGRTAGEFELLLNGLVWHGRDNDAEVWRQRPGSHHA